MMKKILAALVLIAVLLMVFFYFGTYSEGTQAGVIMKIQNKGVIFKTWEGRLDMGTVGKSSKETLGTKIFEFSIDGGDKELLEKLQKAQLSGNRVNLFFVQKYYKFWWNGETKYFATDVDETNSAPVKDKNEIPGLE